MDSERYSWDGQPPGQGAPFVLGIDRALDLPVQVETRAVPRDLDVFRLEHQCSLRLAHPSIFQDFQLLEEPDQVLLFTQQFPGRTLAEDLVTSEFLSPAKILEVLIPVGQAINYLSGHSLVHRLISPQTIWVHDGLVKLQGSGWAFVDFSRKFVSESKSRWLEPLAYFSPEQIRGERVSNRSDQFSLGALFYRLLSGRRPFPSQNILELVQQIQNDSPDWECIPSVLRPVIRRCMQKEAEQRFPSMAALLAELGVVADCDPARAMGYWREGTESRNVQDYERAAQWFREALNCDRYNSLIHMSLADVLCALEQSEQAREHYTRAVDLAPYDAGARYSLACLELRLGELERAGHYFRQVLVISPNFTSAQEKLSLCL